MRRIFLYLMMLAGLPVLAFAQTQHFSFTANTGDSYSIVVTAATLDGASITAGDEIGVFTPNDLCVGASVWSGNAPLALTAWIDDSQTPNVVDGYAAGDTMFFRIWQQSSDKEFDAEPSYAQGNGTFGNGAFAQVSLAAISSGQPQGLVVTNTNDTGAGSLRQALADANSNAGPDTILFNIPQNDPGFSSDNGTWTIQPLSPLPAISDSELVIDGSSQATFIGTDTNPAGPEIVINGSQAGASTDGLQIFSSQNVIQHLVINGFSSYGILVSGENAYDNEIVGNYIGTDAAGNDSVSNSLGIFISGASGTLVGGPEPDSGNLLSGNRVSGLYIMGDGARGTHIIGNRIGTNAAGDAAIGNLGIGLSLFASDNIVGGSGEGERNLISGNKEDGIRIAGDDNIVMGNFIGTDITGSAAIGNIWDGIGIWGGDRNIIGGTNPGEGNILAGNQSGILIHTNDNVVSGNLIGTDVDGNALGNLFSGIHLSAGARSNHIGPQNTIAYNGLAGIRVYGSNDTTVANTITKNRIYSNASAGIDLVNDGNNNVAPPVIEVATATQISGQAQANAIVEIFSDTEDEGHTYEASVNADNAGHFEWNYTPADSVAGPNITATATDTAGNTSQFSQPKNVTSVAETTESIIPKVFSLSQNYPNPFNPSTTISFSIAKSSRVNLTLYDLLGRKVLILRDEKMQPGEYQFTLNASELASGLYFYRMTAIDDSNKSHVFTKKLTLIK